jgi:hypothetical protein
MRVRENSIVTPIVPVNRTTIGKPYRVVRVADDKTFIIVDDYEIERMCYTSDFKHYYFTTYVVISLFLLVSIIGFASYLFFTK